MGHGGGFETTLSFVGLSNTTSNVLIETFDDDGNPSALLNRPDVVTTIGASIGVPVSIGGAASSYGVEVPAMGTREVLSLNENPSSLEVGYAKITLGRSCRREAVVPEFRERGSGHDDQRVARESDHGTFSILAYGQTGLALLNPPDNGRSAEVTVALFDGAGQMMGESTIALAAGSKAVAFLNQAPFFDSSVVPADFFGSVEVTSTQPVVPVVIKIEGSALVTQTVQPAR